MLSFDIVLVGDFRFPGGTSSAVAHEIRALSGASLNVGLVSVNSPILRNRRSLNPQIQACIDGAQATLVPQDERSIEAALGILHNPLVFETEPDRVPRMRLAAAIVVAHQGPCDRSGVPYYEIETVQSVCSQIVGCRPTWAPISQIVRADLTKLEPQLPLLDEDWRNIIFSEDWTVQRKRRRGALPIIGRHSRPEKEKWPATREELLQVYPDDPSVEVRLLGVGKALAEVMGTIPERWITHKFNDVAPAEFLGTIDYFVYYHHHQWVEAFGRMVAEAIASGAPAILPPYFEEIFGEAALYCPPAEAIPLVRELHADRTRRRRQISRGQRLLRTLHGPEQHVNRIERLLGRLPRFRSGPRPPAAMNDTPARDLHLVSAGNVSVETRAADTFDVVMMADMRTLRDAGLRIAHEIRIQADLGYRTGLLHAPSERIKEPSVRPEIHAAVRSGLAEVVRPENALQCRLLVVHCPEDAFHPLPDKLPRVDTDHIVVVADRRPVNLYDLREKHRLLSLVFRCPPTWSPTSPVIREALLQAWPEIPIAADDWTAAIADSTWQERNFRPERPVIGYLQLARSHFELDRTPAILPDRKVRVLYNREASGDDVPGLIDHLRVGEVSADKFIDSLDFLVVPDDESDVPEALLAEAMTRGVVPLASARIAKRLRGGIVACAFEDVNRNVGDFAAAPGDYTAASRQTARAARDAYASVHHAQRLARMIGRRASPGVAPARERPDRTRVAFVSSNGVGLGHLTRLLAVARRMPDTFQPVFVTMSQAYGIAREFGFPVEYLPFHGYGETAHVGDWNDWFRLQLQQILDAYDIAGVVFDGGAPYSGLVRAIAPWPDVRTVWVRRGMWRESQANLPLLQREKFFDLVIEPRDIADARDAGLTAGLRDGTTRVDPIRLLDDADILDRTAAAAALGIDPGLPAVLIQLGAGSTRDIVTLTRHAVEACMGFEPLQIVIAEWAMGAVAFDLWPGVKVLRGYPISRYFNAFDFTISAAGYNSFNEIISFGLPAIFVANSNPMMDDQDARAAFAQDQGAAFHCPETDLGELRALIAAMLDPNTRAVLRVNSARITLPNGAEEAAKRIVGLVAPTAAQDDNVQVVERDRLGDTTAPLARAS